MVASGPLLVGGEEGLAPAGSLPTPFASPTDLMKSTRIGTIFSVTKLRVIFYRTANGREPVRDWLRSLNRESKKIIGDDIKTVQNGWPLGMPLVASLGGGLWEVAARSETALPESSFLRRKA